MNKSYIKIVNMEQLQVTRCKYEKKVNYWGQAVIEGNLHEEDYDVCKESVYLGKSFTIEAITENSVENVFVGIIKNISFYYNRGYHVKMILQGELARLDMIVNTRIFQNNENSMDDIISIVMKNYVGQQILGPMHGMNIEHMVVQYEETDWKFLCRIIAEAGGCLIPDYSKCGCRFATGVKNGENIDIVTDDFAVNSLYHEYMKKKENGMIMQVEDQLEYVIKGRWNFELGDMVNLNGKTMYVYRAEGKWEGQELIHYYSLRTIGAFKQLSKQNMELIGATFSAIVSKVNHDMVEAVYDVVETYGNREYRYATVYSSANGAGWYCMPEIGDSITITFATEDPESAYASGAVHLSMGEKDADIKFIRNPYNKEIRFTKDTLTITNNNGTEIVISDVDGLKIKSAAAIQITAEKDICISSKGEKITLQGENGVELEKGDSKVIVDGDVKLIGDQVHIQNVE